MIIRNAKITTLLLSATLLSCAMVSIIIADESSAAGEDLSETYGTPSIISIAPGFNWTYTVSYPADLAQYVTTTLIVNDESIAAVSGKTVSVEIPLSATPGTFYNVVIKASMTSPVLQTSHQYIKFKIVDGLTASSSQTANSIVLGSALLFAAQASTGLGTLSWSVTTGKTLPAGLSLDTDGKVTGTPEAVGEHTLYLTVTNGFQSADIVSTFTVYNTLTFTSSPTNGVIAYAL